LDPLDEENLPQSPRIIESVQDDAEDVSDPVKPMIYFDTGDLVGQTLLMEEDGDGLRCCAHIIEILDDHEKKVANNLVLKKFKCMRASTGFYLCFLVRWGVTIFPYVDKWTLAHVIG
jgi:hypothetical protein